MLFLPDETLLLSVGDGFDYRDDAQNMKSHLGKVLRLTRDGAPVFYELIFIDVVDGGLRMRLKHFNPDYTAWEEREEWTTFEPVSFSADEIVFSALTIRRVGEDQITMTLRMRRDGGVREEVMHFRRAAP